MVQLENGDKVWEEYSDFLKEKNQAFSMRARFEVMLYLQGLDSDFFEKTPEATAIREIEEEIQTQATEALAKLEETATEVDNIAPAETKEKPAPKKRKPGRPVGSTNKKKKTAKKTSTSKKTE